MISSVKKKKMMASAKISGMAYQWHRKERKRQHQAAAAAAAASAWRKISVMACINEEENVAKRQQKAKTIEISKMTKMAKSKQESMAYQRNGMAK